MTLLAVALAGALGAPARYLVEQAVSTRVAHRFPWGTFVVNVSGSLALGLLTGLFLYHGLAADAKTIVGTGFVGAYTTFSTYAYETVRLAEHPGGRCRSVGYAVGSVLAGTLAAAGGMAVAAI